MHPSKNAHLSTPVVARPRPTEGVRTSTGSDRTVLGDNKGALTGQGLKAGGLQKKKERKSEILDDFSGFRMFLGWFQVGCLMDFPKTYFIVSLFGAKGIRHHSNKQALDLAFQVPSPHENQLLRALG